MILGDLILHYNDKTEQFRQVSNVYVHPEWNSDSISSGWVYLLSITASLLSTMHTNNCAMFIYLPLLLKNVSVHLVMTLPCWSCPLQFQSPLTWERPLCLHLVRSYPTTTSATWPDMDVLPVSLSQTSVCKIRWDLAVALHFCPTSLSPQLVAVCPTEWGRSFFIVLTTRPALAQAGGGARSRPVWSVQAGGRSQVVTWVQCPLIGENEKNGRVCRIMQIWKNFKA